MNQEYNDSRYYREFRHLAKEFPRFKAVCYINELWCKPGIGISASQLYNLYNNVETPCLDTNHTGFYCPQLNSAAYYPPELPIAICDEQTLRQVREAVGTLNRSLSEARYNNDLARAEECEQQLATVSCYLKDCITSHKRLRYLNNLDHDLSLLIYRSVQALYKALEPEYPSLVGYLKQHVVIGVRCYWSESPVKQKDKPENT
jgi:hypothetical protein